jgi:MOSC domain-containing protein YiiM
MSAPDGSVASVSCNDVYSFTKPARDEIVLVAGVGVEGDVHAGVRVRHRSRVRADPTQPNLRQVHLIQSELFGEVGEKGYTVAPGNLGENVTTVGIDLLALPTGTVLRFGPPDGGPAAGTTGDSRAGDTRAAVEAVLAAAAAATLDEPTAAAAAAVADAAGRDPGTDPRPAIVIAGLRNPCAQINGFQAGLLKEVLVQDAYGNPVRKAGVMAVVLRRGPIRPDDPIHVELPPAPHRPLERV